MAPERTIRDRLYWESHDFIEAIEDEWFIRLDLDQAIHCKTLGEFELFVIRTIHEQPSEPDEAFIQRILDDINSSAPANIEEPITFADLRLSVETIARATPPGPWDSVYFAINQRLHESLPRVRLTSISRVFTAAFVLLILALSALLIWHFAWWAGCMSFVLTLIAVAAIVDRLPKRTETKSPTLRDAIIEYHRRLIDVRDTMPPPEIALLIRKCYASWVPAKVEPDEIDETEDISWIWSDWDGKPLVIE